MGYRPDELPVPDPEQNSPTGIFAQARVKPYQIVRRGDPGAEPQSVAALVVLVMLLYWWISQG